MKTFFSILILCAASAAQVAIGKIDASAATSCASAVAVKVSYSLPSDYTWQADPAMSPAKVIWLWGDDAPGAKSRHYSEAAYGVALTHTYEKPGTYTIIAVVNDRKNRNIDQRAIVVRVNPLVEINPTK